jgi:hypothetical protein
MTAAARTITRLLRKTAFAALLALSLTAVGCWEEKNPMSVQVENIYPPQTSPANVLHNLYQAYWERNIDEYRKLFAEDYTFVFDPQDPVDANHAPPSTGQWGLADELTSTRNMFADTLVRKVEINDWHIGSAEPLDSLQYGPRAWKVQVDAVNLMVATQTEDSDSLTFVVEGRTEVFYFREEPARPVYDGKPTWFIFRWDDWVMGGAKVRQTSWGMIKALYR